LWFFLISILSFSSKILSSTCSSLLKWPSTVFCVWLKGLFSLGFLEINLFSEVFHILFNSSFTFCGCYCLFIYQYECEESKNRDKKIVMVKLIIQKKKTRYRNNKKFSLLVKVLELFLRHPIIILVYKQGFWCGLTRWLVCE
jgi:hypothetical protein